jgi:hypothetical protein
MKEMKEGDRIISVNLVDLAITLFTLGVTFYDPDTPYIYQKFGERRVVKFHFDTESSIAGVGHTTDLMLGWRDAEFYCEPLGLVPICKRVIWERRTLLKEVNNPHLSVLHDLAKGCERVDDLKLAAIAYALGYRKPEAHVIAAGDTKAFLVGSTSPPWLREITPDLSGLATIIESGVEFIERPGNELHPIAVAHATFINAVAWLDHLKTDKPYLQFQTTSGKSYWVKEGSDRWRELLELGYAPL